MRLTPPQAGHLQSALTSFNALPAICLCLFFMCEVFFLGTALSIDSQIPSRSDGSDGRFRCIEAGTANTIDGNAGRDSCRIKTEANLEDECSVGDDILGSIDELAAIRTHCEAAAIVPCRPCRPAVNTMLPG